MAHGFADLVIMLECRLHIQRRRINSLLNDLELLHEDGGKLLDEMGPVAGVLKLDDDSLDNLIIDALEVDFLDNRNSGVGRLVGC